MVEAKSFRKRKLIPKFYWKCKNVAKVQRVKFQTDLLMYLNVACIRDKFEKHGTVQDLYKQQFWRPCTSTDPKRQKNVEKLIIGPQENLFYKQLAK